MQIKPSKEYVYISYMYRLHLSCTNPIYKWINPPQYDRRNISNQSSKRQ